MNESPAERRKRIASMAGEWCGGSLTIPEARHRDGTPEYESRPGAVAAERAGQVVKSMKARQTQRRREQVGKRLERRAFPRKPEEFEKA